MSVFDYAATSRFVGGLNWLVAYINNRGYVAMQTDLMLEDRRAENKRERLPIYVEFSAFKR